MIIENPCQPLFDFLFVSFLFTYYFCCLSSRFSSPAVYIIQSMLFHPGISQIIQYILHLFLVSTLTNIYKAHTLICYLF
ncbi:hypothetical protein FGO68_gene11719 [Halteria grandinella]|uniref:Uncharacterized protein n=1 Tax=Halteria grandinella TaxID=5974 RepID=A0A8J8NAY9_HALGN|nr:hypothetical protein FGO68_gene11719 [Halteria grandinella]